MELFDWRRRAELPFVNRYEGLEFEVIGREKFEELAERLLSGSVTFGVLAAITDNSPGSAWIPYEYGRVKPRSIASQLASCWHNPRAAVIPAEYMNLGPIFRDEMAIRRWLAAEKTRFPLCTRTTSKYRGGDLDEPKKLPE
jgi:hypothetical protein